jgi:hypothetical protein
MRSLPAPGPWTAPKLRECDAYCQSGAKYSCTAPLLAVLRRITPRHFGVLSRAQGPYARAKNRLRVFAYKSSNANHFRHFRDLSRLELLITPALRRPSRREKVLSCSFGSRLCDGPLQSRAGPNTQRLYSTALRRNFTIYCLGPEH